MDDLERAALEGARMTTLDYDTIAAMKPCWLREEDGDACLRAACARLGDTFTALDVLRAEWLSPGDRIWVATCRGVLEDSVLRRFAARAARRALEGERAAGREPDPRSWAAVETAERYARGEATDRELAEARAAAWSAAAWSAAVGASAWEAAARAARAADAADAAAWAAWAAADAAAWAARAAAEAK